jgi:tripartite-type tricarboxylate transporter receptor subunit TctC
MSVRGDSPIQNVQDLVKQAKANPGKLTIGTQGVASAGDFVAMSFESAAGAQLTRVPFTGAGPARNALLAGEINIVPASLAEALEFAKGTNWRILGQMAEKRTEAAPNVPTFKEQGLDIVWVNSRGFAAPKATPPDVLEKYRQGFADLFKDAEFIAKANAANQQLVYVTGEDFRKDLDDLDKMLRSLRTKGIWK